MQCWYVYPSMRHKKCLQTHHHVSPPTFGVDILLLLLYSNIYKRLKKLCIGSMDATSMSCDSTDYSHCGQIIQDTIQALKDKGISFQKPNGQWDSGDLETHHILGITYETLILLPYSSLIRTNLLLCSVFQLLAGWMSIQTYNLLYHI